MILDDRIANLIKAPFETFSQILDERQRRLLAASMAKAYGYGGIKLIGDLTGMDPRTISSGIREIEDTSTPIARQTRVRKAGAGRKALKAVEPELLDRILSIIEDNSSGDTEKILSWTSLSLRDISSLLKEKFGMEVGKDVVSRILEELGYSKLQNQKVMQSGTTHVDKDAQFSFINVLSKAFIHVGDPVISVDAKKKDLIGKLNDNGSEYRPAWIPKEVWDHGFEIQRNGKTDPCGVCPVKSSLCLLKLGPGHDNGAFAAESIRSWWNIVGKLAFPNSKRLYIVCDGTGCNGWRLKLMKIELAMFAEETGLEVHVSHFPSGTFRWNKIVHQLFCFTSRNWAGKTLTDINAIVSLISSEAVKSGLKVQYDTGTDRYPSGSSSADDEVMKKIDIETVGPNVSWNYIIRGFKQ